MDIFSHTNDSAGSTDMDIFWELFGGAPLLVQGLSLLQLAFTVWMVVDAYRHHADSFWYWIILFFQPIGAWIYFFAVKLPTLRLPRRRPGLTWGSNLSLDELRYRVERTPTLANRFALAVRLMERGEHTAAIPYLEAVLAVEAD